MLLRYPSLGTNIHSVLPLVLDRKEHNTKFECKLICHVFGVLGNLHGLKDSLLDLIFGTGSLGFLPWQEADWVREDLLLHIPAVDCPNPPPQPISPWHHFHRESCHFQNLSPGHKGGNEFRMVLWTWLSKGQTHVLLNRNSLENCIRKVSGKSLSIIPSHTFWNFLEGKRDSVLHHPCHRWVT